MSRLYLAAAAANAWVLLAILAGAFVMQFIAGDPPCPLCMMQRIAMLLAAVGCCHVLAAGHRGVLTARDIGVGAGITLLACLLGGAISIRQVLLHILPGDPGFGPAVLGWHTYTWAAVIFACNLVATGLQLASLAWFTEAPPRPLPLARPTMLAVAAMLVANILSVVAESGFAWTLPENPVGYLLFR
ncbi:disulfide bond formation protein B [Humitalea sp. 24SJ18S-53]|uniref:disulfide bond formation protein B n=1 Tax=Humitalea sp. 24SJ18S-53 TaxID=3422307 RepID=UPI003D67C622